MRKDLHRIDDHLLMGGAFLLVSALLAGLFLVLHFGFSGGGELEKSATEPWVYATFFGGYGLGGLLLVGVGAWLRRRENRIVRVWDLLDELREIRVAELERATGHSRTQLLRMMREINTQAKAHYVHDPRSDRILDGRLRTRVVLIHECENCGAPSGESLTLDAARELRCTQCGSAVVHDLQRLRKRLVDELRSEAPESQPVHSGFSPLVFLLLLVVTPLAIVYACAKFGLFSSRRAQEASLAQARETAQTIRRGEESREDLAPPSARESAAPARPATRPQPPPVPVPAECNSRDEERPQHDRHFKNVLVTGDLLVFAACLLLLYVRFRVGFSLVFGGWLGEKHDDFFAAWGVESALAFVGLAILSAGHLLGREARRIVQVWDILDGAREVSVPELMAATGFDRPFLEHSLAQIDRHHGGPYVYQPAGDSIVDQRLLERRAILRTCPGCGAGVDVQVTLDLPQVPRCEHCGRGFGEELNEQKERALQELRSEPRYAVHEKPFSPWIFLLLLVWSSLFAMGYAIYKLMKRPAMPLWPRTLERTERAAKLAPVGSLSLALIVTVQSCLGIEMETITVAESKSRDLAWQALQNESSDRCMDVCRAAEPLGCAEFDMQDCLSDCRSDLQRCPEPMNDLLLCLLKEGMRCDPEQDNGIGMAKCVAQNRNVEKCGADPF